MISRMSHSSSVCPSLVPPMPSGVGGSVLRSRRSLLRSALPLLGLAPLSARGEEAKHLRLFPHNQRTKFFHFYYMKETPMVQEMMRFADAFVRIIHRQFFTADYAYPIQMLVLENRERLEVYLRKEFKMKGPVPEFTMMFIPELNCFITEEGTGLGTITHNLAHPLVETNLPLHPVWATQGVSSFFEKFYGYWKGDELVLEFGFQNPWRLKAIGDELPNLNLRQILGYKDPLGRFSGSEQRLVAMFMWRHGKLKPMLKLIEKGIPPEGYQTWFEAAMGKQVADIIPMWKTYLTEVAADRDNVTLPNSCVLPDEATYRQYASLHKLDRRQELPLPPEKQG